MKIKKGSLDNSAALRYKKPSSPLPPRKGGFGGGISWMNHYRALSLLGLPIVIGQAGVIVLGLQINFANALRGISDVKPMMLIAFVSYFVISLPAGYLCGFVFGWGMEGVWMAFPFGLTSAGLMLWLRFRYKVKR